MGQDIVVYLIVAGAVAYLARTFWLTARGKKGCASGCGGCSKTAQPAARGNAAPAPGNLIQIDLGARPASIARPDVARTGAMAERKS